MYILSVFSVILKFNWSKSFNIYASHSKDILHLRKRKE